MFEVLPATARRKK